MTCRALIGLASLLCIAMLGLGCSGSQEQKTATIELEGNPSTGYTWVYTVSQEGVVREVSNEYIPDKHADGRVGSGGRFIFTFDALTTGEAKLTFSYLRIWEEDTPPVNTVVYRAVVDGNNRLTLARE